jgi:hypothetical protein
MRMTASFARALAFCVTLVCVHTAVAVAASPAITRQAAAANAAFLAYAPPPEGGPRALCLVDTGVDATPDTTPGLVSATALDGGTGSDVDTLKHGTIDAAVAGGAGHGVLGAWPQLKIVSVRATDNPAPGQLPTYQWDDYTAGIAQCSKPVAGVAVAAIVIPLSSTIPPTPDQVDEFNAATNSASAQQIALLAAAGNEPGVIQLPGNQPGFLPVGAIDTVGGGICPFSASTGLTFFAPGCTIDQIDSHGEAVCCGNGTSQASAFAAGILVALRSYAPALTAEQATRLLVSTARAGKLDATAAFMAAGLDSIVDAGNSAVPRPPAPPPAVAPPQVPEPMSRVRLPRPRVRRATWHGGVLRISIRGLPPGSRLHAKVTFAHRRAMFLSTNKSSLRARTPPPHRVRLHLTANGASSPAVTIRVTRTRRGR